MTETSPEIAGPSSAPPSSTTTAEEAQPSTTQTNGPESEHTTENNDSHQTPVEKPANVPKTVGAPRGRRRSAFGVIHRKRQVLRKRGPKPKVDTAPVNGQVRHRKRGRPRLIPKKEVDSDGSPIKNEAELAALADPEEIEKILMIPVEEAEKEQNGVDDLKAYIGYEKVRTKPRKERIKKNMSNGQYQCPFCSFQSQYYSAVASHTLIHTGEKPYKCQICDYRARQRGHIVVHMRMHSGSKPFTCPDCDYATIQRSHLRVHMQVHSSERPYQCHTCAYRSKHQSILKAHMKKYGHEKAYACTECSYTSARKHNLLQHMTLHTGLKPYKCDLCPYESNQKGHLNVHIRTHTREKPFKCNECPFASTVPKSLREHMTMHEGKRPLQCPYCSFSTSQPFSIKNHIALHEDTKMFKCKFCSYTTSIEKDFQTHRSIHVQSSSYCCTMCTFTTPFKHQFDNHLISHRELDIKDKGSWDRRIKAERLSPTSPKGHQVKKRLRSTSRKPLQFTANGNSSGRANSPGRAKSPTKVHVNGHADVNNHSLSSSSEDLRCAMVDYNNKQKSPSTNTIQPPKVKTEVTSEDATTNRVPPMPTTAMAPPKAVTRLHHQTRIADLESSKMHYKVYKPDIIRRKMAGIAKFFCDYCARPFVEHEDWKKHVIRHFMEWPEIDGY